MAAVDKHGIIRAVGTVRLPIDLKTDSTGRKIITKEAQKGCLSFSIRSFQLVENLPERRKTFSALRAGSNLFRVETR